MTGTIIHLAEYQPRSQSNIPARNIHSAGPTYEAKPTKDRWRNFRRAENMVEYLKARELAIFHASILVEQHGYDAPDCRADAALWRDADFERRLADARLELLLTPVSRRAEMDLKQKIFARHGDKFKGNLRTIKAAIAADESYLAIPRQHRKRGPAGKAVRS